MKRFVELWNEAFPGALTKKLGIEVRWEPSDELPVAVDSLAVELCWRGIWNGRCVLIGAWGEIADLIGDSSAKEPSAKNKAAKDKPAKVPDENAARSWLDWVREVVAAMQIPVQPESVELIERPRGVPLIPHLVRVGKRAARIALVCDVKTEPEAATRAAEIPGATESGSGAFAGTGNANLDLLLDIEVDASLRFGSREIAIRELLATGPGDVLELDRTISDPVDLVVGDKIVARGEVVLVNGNFGLRVTEVAEPRKCLESVRCLF